MLNVFDVQTLHALTKDYVPITGSIASGRMDACIRADMRCPYSTSVAESRLACIDSTNARARVSPFVRRSNFGGGDGDMDGEAAPNPAACANGPNCSG